jgi:putative N-acetyltransferase (TIGR04045 family)
LPGAGSISTARAEIPARPAAPALDVCIADAPEHLERHLAIRRAVFCAEQGLFGGADDRDALDDDPATLHVVGLSGGVVEGTVRLYELGPPGLWQGDRLAVLPEARHTRLGAALVRFAVRTAGERGGLRMVAMIQLPNVCFFEALGWQRHGAVATFHGIDHQPMAIALNGAARGR